MIRLTGLGPRPLRRRLYLMPSVSRRRLPLTLIIRVVVVAVVVHPAALEEGGGGRGRRIWGVRLWPRGLGKGPTRLVVNLVVLCEY